MAKKTTQKRKSGKRKQHYNKGYKKIAFIVVLILIIILIGKLANNGQKETNNKIAQVILNNENITTKLKRNIILENNKVYMSYSDIQEFLDERIYQENETGLIITSSNKKVAAIKENEENIIINGANQKVQDIIIERDGEKYIAISELENVYDYNLEYISNTNVITIDNLSKKLVKAYAKKNIDIKEESKMFSNVLEKVQKGKWLVYISEKNGMAKVRTQNGNIGYVKKKLLNNFVTEREEFSEQEKKKKSNEELQEYDITGKDISNFEKRLDVINLILKQAIKNDKIELKIIYNGGDNSDLERLKIEATPMLRECGIKIEI